MPLSISSTLPLHDGNNIPIIVFGSRAESIHQALDLGWRAFDTAQMYGNEAAIGAAIRSYPAYASGELKRPDVWVTTKLNGQASGPQDDLLGTIRESVEKIGLGGYVDLFIIHNPYGSQEGRRKQWEALVEAKRLGLVKSIGVSNFGPKHLEEIKAYSSEMPVSNQVEVHPYNQEPALKAYCLKENILIQPYSPVARGSKKDDPALLAVAREVGRTWNQVMLRWGVQRGHNVVCGSRRPEGNLENAQIFEFELSESQMGRLDALECGFRVCPENPLDRDEQPKFSWDGEKVTLL